MKQLQKTVNREKNIQNNSCRKTYGRELVPSSNGDPWLFVDLPITDYGEVLALQRRVVAAKARGELAQNVLVLVEHPSVFTLGQRGGRENLIVSDAFLRERGVQVVQVERGGNITWHGPGQLVAYPIMDLKKARLSVVDYVMLLEEVMLKTLSHFGVEGRRDKNNRGVWVGESKIGSVGIRIREGISFHGLALNVAPDLTPFTWINPCGLKGVSMTSIEKACGKTIPLGEARRVLASCFSTLFNAVLEKGHI